MVDFLASGNWDPLSFADNQLTLLCVNIEEERTMRPDDLYRRNGIDGKPLDVHPEIRLQLYLLFVAKFNDYKEAWKQLFAVIKHFQRNRFFRASTHPDLPDDLEQLVMELVTLPFSEQNELWSALKVTYHPSVLYRAELVMIQDDEVEMAPEVREIQNEVGQS